MRFQSHILCPGRACGLVLRLEAPISFWGGVDPETSQIMAAGHPQQGQSIAETMLVVPRLIGSSSSSAVLLELIYQKKAPRALILGTSDAILPVGVLVSEEMGWGTVPVVQLKDPPFLTGEMVALTASGQIERAF